MKSVLALLQLLRQSHSSCAVAGKLFPAVLLWSALLHSVSLDQVLKEGGTGLSGRFPQPICVSAQHVRRQKQSSVLLFRILLFESMSW